MHSPFGDNGGFYGSTYSSPLTLVLKRRSGVIRYALREAADEVKNKEKEVVERG